MSDRTWRVGDFVVAPHRHLMDGHNHAVVVGGCLNGGHPVDIHFHLANGSWDRITAVGYRRATVEDLIPAAAALSEPTKRYAVMLDSDGDPWVRTERHREAPWQLGALIRHWDELVQSFGPMEVPGDD